MSEHSPKKPKKGAITFHGGVGTPTGSNFLFETPHAKILIDCGLIQGRKVAEDENREPFAYDPASIDALFVTHAHVDHVGRIPSLVKNGFRGKIYSTPPTKEIGELMLIDSLGVLEKEAKRHHQPLIYKEEDVKKAFAFWETAPYGEEIKVKDELTVVFREAGHILGSSLIEIKYGSKKLMFTGDIGNTPAPILRDTAIVTDINYLVMESVYGDRNHEDRDKRKEILENVIEDTVQKKGTLIIPAFSLERTQELLYEIDDLVEHGRIPLVPVFLDSPLAIKVTDVYRKYSSYFNADARNIIRAGDDIFKFPMLKFTLHTEESKAIKDVPSPKIIIAGSGMSNGGRIVHHERAYLPDANNTLLLIGYQAAGTPGRELQEGSKRVRILGEEVAVNAKVVTIHGYSAHRDSNGLFELVHQMGDSVEKVFVVLGEPKSSFFLTQRLRDYLGVNARVPDKGEIVELDF